MKRLFPPLQYLNIPNAMTSLAIVLGITCLVLLANGFTRLPAALFILVFMLDFFDGVAARRLKQTSPLGGDLDSLADALNFVAIPAIVGWSLGMRSVFEIGILCLYVLAGIWRLAFYNVHGLDDEEQGNPTFTGLPTTYAAAYFVVAVCLSQTLNLGIHWIGSIYLGVSALFMISALPVRKKGLILPVTTISVVGSVLLYVLRG